jgi:hypothetical protein
MIIKTKKYQLDSITYLKLGMAHVARKWWWAWLIPVGIMLLPILYAPAFWWCFGISLTALVLYVLFWVVQFVGITQMEQYKPLFEKLSYEIGSQQILIKLNAKEGMPVRWEQVQEVKVGKQAYTLVLSLAQFIHLPFDVFRSERDLKFMDMLLKRKGLVAKGASAEPEPLPEA